MLEDKEKEFKEYVVGQLSLLTGTNTQNMLPTIRNVAHTLIQDFKEEIEGFNVAMSEELENTKEELNKYKEALDVYYRAIHGD